MSLFSRFVIVDQNSSLRLIESDKDYILSNSSFPIDHINRKECAENRRLCQKKDFILGIKVS